MHSKWLSGALLLSLLSLGCRAKSSLPHSAPPDILPPAAAPPQAPDEPAKNPLDAQLVVPKTQFKSGESVPLVLTLRNNSKQDQALRFTSGQRFDFWLRRPNQKAVVWRWSIDKLFTQNLRTETLKAGATQTFRDVWNQTDNAGQIVPRGTYLLHGVVTANSHIEAAPVTIELTD